MQDRERFLALPLVPEVQQHSNSNPSNNNNHQNPPGGSGAAMTTTQSSTSTASLKVNENVRDHFFTSLFLPVRHGKTTNK